MADLEIIAIHDIGEVRPGDDLANLIAAADDADLCDGDCLVITQKVVSKAEGRLVDIDPTDPLSHKPLVEASRFASCAARRTHHLQTEHGFVCANAGIDLSNVSGVRPPAAGRQRRSARIAIAYGPGTATTSPSSSATPLVAPGVAVSPMSPSVAPVSGPSPTCEEPPTHSARAHGHRGRGGRRDRRRRGPRDGQSQRCRRRDRPRPRSRVVRARFGRRRDRSRSRRRSFR